MTIDGATARSLLDDERRRLQGAVQTVTGDLAEERSGAGDELASYDQHPAEMGTEVSDTSRDLGLLEDFRARLAENDAARQRLDAGAYGRCERCGAPIGEERLRAVPSARYCVEHQRTGA